MLGAAEGSAAESRSNVPAKGGIISVERSSDAELVGAKEAGGGWIVAKLRGSDGAVHRVVAPQGSSIRTEHRPAIIGGQQGMETALEVKPPRASMTSSAISGTPWDKAEEVGMMSRKQADKFRAAFDDNGTDPAVQGASPQWGDVPGTCAYTENNTGSIYGCAERTDLGNYHYATRSYATATPSGTWSLTRARTGSIYQGATGPGLGESRVVLWEPDERTNVSDCVNLPLSIAVRGVTVSSDATICVSGLDVHQLSYDRMIAQWYRNFPFTFSSRNAHHLDVFVNPGDPPSGWTYHVSFFAI